MFTTLAQTYFRATGISPERYHGRLPSSWYGENMRAPADPKRWEDWK